MAEINSVAFYKSVRNVDDLMFDKVFALTDGLSHELSFKSLEVRHLDKAYSFYHYFFQEAADVRPPICLEPVTAAFSAAVPAKLPFIPLPA